MATNFKYNEKNTVKADFLNTSLISKPWYPKKDGVKRIAWYHLL